MYGRDSVLQRRAILLVSIMIISSIGTLGTNASITPKTTTIWSGSVFLADGYNVETGQILIVQPGTNIILGNDEEIIIDGRISIEGTITSPVVLDSINGNHNGIVFNATSNGLNSVIDNLTINDAKYGITIYGSNPVITNLIVVNADNVAVDLFESATPYITNLTIEGGGQDVHSISTSWRYGVGLSVGVYSTPVVNGANINGLITRGINFWGNSGGLFSNINISNISGATISVSAGIWVEDSIPLMIDSRVNRCDNGVFVRHQTSGWVTRPSFSGIVVENSQYRGIMVEQYNHSQYFNLPTNAIFSDLEIRGTGGPNAKTPGLGYAAFDVNTSGVSIDGALIEDNPVVGFRAYMTDSSTRIENATFLNNGKESPSTPMNDRAGLFLRSASWSTKGPAIINNLIVNNSTGPGVLMMKGGAIGNDWLVSGNGGNGIDLREFHPKLDSIVSKNNEFNGIYVFDSSNVEISNAKTEGNGIGQSDPEKGAGIFFHESNTVMSGGKNTSCTFCTSTGDQHGILIRDSIDLQLNSIIVQDSISPSSLDIDNSGIVYFGTVNFNNVTIHSNSSQHALNMIEVDAIIDNLEIHGQNGGLLWEAKGITPSSMSDSIISGTENSCLDIINQIELSIDNTSILCHNNNPTLDASIVNFTDSSLIQNSELLNSFALGSNNHLRWISSSNINAPSYESNDNIFDIMWNIDVHTVNQKLMNIPYADINISFELYEDELIATQPYSGHYLYGPFVGKRWSPLQGWSENNTVNIGCDYDGVHNDTSIFILNSDKLIVCRLDISNQAPFILWQSPEDKSKYSSASEVIFDATESWDLDLDPISFSWSSDIDGEFTMSCLQGNNIANYSYIIANNGTTCLSDGIHQITLQVCDNNGHCVNETREIELLNLPPILSVGTIPKISSLGTLYLGQTANLTVILSGTYDPEGGDLWCWIETSYEEYFAPGTAGDPICPQEITRSFVGAPDQFTVTVYASDGINPNRTWSFSVRLYNELPDASMEIIRIGNNSANTVRIDGSNTIDPEGDTIKFEFSSSLDGILTSGLESTTNVEWIGKLSKGIHNITMKASDDDPNHSGRWTYHSIELEVLNSPPVTLISRPSSGIIAESADLIQFESSGSGDWDLACSELPDNGSDLFCNPILPTSDDLVSILWSSDKLIEPIGTDWNFEARLPAGNHNITLSLNDGYVEVNSTPINIIIQESAPVLILDSPMPDIEVYSNSPILFDFRNSFDPDGNQFTVSVYSDIMGYILENKTADYWYNDYLVAGNHQLTLTLIDSNGMQRVHVQQITVLETAPIAEITNLTNGQYIPPGHLVNLDASSSYDYDNDIVLYRWFLNDGTIISEKKEDNMHFNPGAVQINLLVQDSRGTQAITAVNLTIGFSYPNLQELTISIDSIEANLATEVYVYVILDDPDGTTNLVNGERIAGGISEPMVFRDDGKGSDQVADDNIWTYRSNWLVSEGNWVKIEVWAIDGELVSQSEIESIPIVKEGSRSSLNWLINAGLPFLIISLSLLTLLGIFYAKNRRIQIAKDMQLIDSWSGFNPRDLDENFDKENES
mgnify:CR=1 FL=1